MDEESYSYDGEWDDGAGNVDEFDDRDIDDLTPGETIEARNARILAEAATQRQLDRPTHTTESDPRKQFFTFDADEGDGLGHDHDAIERLIAEAASAAGYSVAALVAAIPRGRLKAPEQARRDALAKAVAAARDQGARVEALAEVLRRPTSTIAALETRGRALLASKSEG
jgi:hypothetical protein